MTRMSLLLAALGIAAIVVLFRVPERPGAPESMPTDHPESDAGRAAALRLEGEQLLSAALDRLAQKEGKEPSSVSDAQDDGQGALEPAIRKSEWLGYPRSREDLAALFMVSPDTVQPNRIVRHPDLNLEDRVLSPLEIYDLERLLALYKQVIDPLRQQYNRIRIQEMRDAIERGVVEPVPSITPDEGAIQKRAQMFAKFAKEQGHPESTAEVFAERLRSNPTYALTGINHFRYKGQAYLTSSFGHLPLSDGYYGDIRFIYHEFLVAVVDWFSVRGLTTYPAMSPHIERALSYTMVARRAEDKSAGR